MKRVMILSIVAVMTFSSCVSKAGDASRLVPQDAYAAVLAESPVDLFRSADSFFKAAGLDRLTDGKSLLETIREHSGEKENMKAAAEALDFGKPFALTLVPDRSGDEPGVSVVLWLPLKEAPDSYDKLTESLGGFGGDGAFVNGYAALCFNGPAPKSLPSRAADLSRLSGYPKDSIKAWVNVESLREDFGAKWTDALKGAFDRSRPEEGTADGPGDINAPYDYNERNFDWDEYLAETDSGFGSKGLLGGTGGLTELMNKAAENVKTLDFALGVRETGAYLRMGAAVPEDRALGKMVAAAGSAKGLSYLKYLETDALMGGAASLDPAALAPFMELYVKALGMEEYLGRGYFELLRSSYAAMGPDSAFSFDATLDPDFARKAGQVQTPEEIGSLIRESLSLELSQTGSLRDKDLYRKSLKMLEDEEVFGETFNSLLESMGLEMDIKIEEGSEGTIAYDAVRITLDGPSVSGSPQSKAALDALMGKLTVYSACQKDKVYSVLGDPRLLSEAVKRDGAAAPIASDAKYKAFAATLPRNTRGIYYVSLRRLFEIVSPFAPNALPGSPENLDKLYGYYAMGKGSLETGLFLGARDFKAIFDLIPGTKALGQDGI